MFLEMFKDEECGLSVERLSRSHDEGNLQSRRRRAQRVKTLRLAHEDIRWRLPTPLREEISFGSNKSAGLVNVAARQTRRLADPNGCLAQGSLQSGLQESHQGRIASRRPRHADSRVRYMFSKPSSPP